MAGFIRHASLVLALTLFLFIFVASASPSTRPDSSPNPVTILAREAPLPLNCTSEAAQDFYGLGVRLGVYFIWLSSYIANNFVPDEIASSFDANAIFLLALIATIFTQSAKRTLTTIDGLVLMELSSGYMFGVLSIWGYRTVYYRTEGPRAIRHFGRFGTHFRLILATAISVYGVWFWYKGVKGGLIKVENDGCETLYTFFFAKFRIGGGIEIYYVVVTIGCALWYGSMCLAAIAAEVRRLWTTSYGRNYTVPGCSKKPLQFHTGFNQKELDLFFVILRCWNIFWIMFSILMVELTLKYNHVLDMIGLHTKVANPSQLLPLLIGALSFARILWIWLWRGPEEEEMPGGECECECEPTTGVDSPSAPEPSSFISRASRRLSLHAYAKALIPVHGDFDESDHIKRPLLLRYTVAMMPWLSLFDFWTKPGRMHRHGGSNEVDEAHPHGLAISTTTEDALSSEERAGYKIDPDSPSERLQKETITEKHDEHGDDESNSALSSPRVRFSKTLE